MAKNTPKERKFAMYEAILQLKDLDECCRFFDDLCAVTELRAMEQRFEVASMLMDDKVYMEIMEKSNASSATISRVNRMLNYGTGCLPEMIRRIKENSQMPEEESAAAPSSEAGGRLAEETEVSARVKAADSEDSAESAQIETSVSADEGSSARKKRTKKS